MNTPDSCLDAETLAAWMDDGLSGPELRMAQTHVANCARCQTLVGAMARTSAAVPAIEPQHATRRWLAWAVPLTAAATALVIWTTVPRNTTAPAPESAPAATVANAPAEQRSEEAAQAKAAPAPAPLERKADAPPRPTAASPAVESRGNVAQDTIAAEARASTAQEASKDVAASAPPTTPAPPAAPTARTTTLAAPAAARAQAANVPAERFTADIVTPNPMIRWRIAGPSMERSIDGGATWTAVPTGIATPLAAAAAPTADVCWAVGRLGIVLLTTDARTWRGISFPVITDLSAVTATDARTATVTTADGRAFSTTDGGVTWTAR